MSSGEGGSRASSKKGDARTLRVETGERVILSPQSDRFRDHYRRVQPRTATKVRNLIGLSGEMARLTTSESKSYGVHHSAEVLIWLKLGGVGAPIVKVCATAARP
jgi:hypothetical protein